MIVRRSLRVRLTVAYAICAFAVLVACGLIAAAAIFTVGVRGQRLAFERTVRIVEADVARAPAAEPLAVTQRRVVAEAASRGIGVVAISPAVYRNPGGAPYGLIDVGGYFRLAPKAIPIRDGGLFVVPPARNRARTATAFEWLAAVVTVFAALGAWRLALFGANETLRPLLVVTAELERFGSGDFTPRHLRLSATSEFRRLARAYNGTADNVARAFLERRSVEERIRQFVADAGHELRTPLTVVSGYVDVLRREKLRDAAGRRDAFASVATELERMRRLVGDLTKLARLDGVLEREREVVDLDAIARDVIRSLSVVATAPVALAAQHLRVAGDPGDVYEAIENLLLNALKYGAGTPVEVTVGAERTTAVVRVRDGGPGIPESERERIFERFYRGRYRPDVAGSGLGLAIASKAAERLGGRIVLEEARAGSTTFAIRLPLLPEGDAPAASG